LPCGLHIGEFNVDFVRDWAHTRLLNSFLELTETIKKYSVVRSANEHSCCTVDYVIRT